MIPPKQSGEFVAHMERVLDVYKRPYNPDNPVVCMDESPKQLIEAARLPLPIKPGIDKKEDYEYIRHGVVNIFMANEPLRQTFSRGNGLQKEKRLGIVHQENSRPIHRGKENNIGNGQLQYTYTFCTLRNF